jgi:cellulose biosynthesis protein BcsQ
VSAKIICMASSKGGSGKTVLTATFGAFLAGIGKTVLLIDTDAATNGLTLLYLKETLMQGEYAFADNHQPKGIYDLVTDLSPPDIVKLKNGCNLIPATYNFQNTELIDEDKYRGSLVATLQLVRDSYDYIFLDAQAGSDVFAQIAMNRRISDEVVIVSEYDPMSAAGVERLKGLLREDLTYVRTWVLLNKMLPDFVQSFSDFLEVAKYLSPIPWDAEVVLAYARRRLALDLANGNEYTLAVFQTLKGLLGEEISNNLLKWVESRATNIREPIKLQHSDVMNELEGLLKERRRIENMSQRRKTLVTLIIVSAVSIAGIFFGMIFLNSIGSLGKFEVATNIAMSIVMATAGLLWYREFTKLDPVQNEVALDQIARRKERLQEKLEKLEMLLEADPETLIKKMHRGQDL